MAFRSHLEKDQLYKIPYKSLTYGLTLVLTRSNTSSRLYVFFVVYLYPAQNLCRITLCFVQQALNLICVIDLLLFFIIFQSCFKFTNLIGESKYNKSLVRLPLYDLTFLVLRLVCGLMSCLQQLIFSIIIVVQQWFMFGKLFVSATISC